MRDSLLVRRRSVRAVRLWVIDIVRLRDRAAEVLW